MLSKGEHLLKVNFTGLARSQLISNAQQSVGLLQDLACEGYLEAGYEAGGLVEGAEVNEER